MNTHQPLQARRVSAAMPGLSQRPSAGLSSRLLPALLATGFAACALVALPSRAALTIGNNPLYLVAGKANVLITLDNSNSMDEAADGSAVGSNSAASKSEIDVAFCCFAIRTNRWKNGDMNTNSSIGPR